MNANPLTPDCHHMFADAALPELIRARLHAAPAGDADVGVLLDDYFDSPPHEAAVLMPLMRQPDGWHLLFIRRAENENDRHSGQVAFPGGRVDPRDPTHIAAALREAEEEIGLGAGNVDVLGTLGSCRTVSNFCVTPVIGRVLCDFSPRPEPREVARVFSIPLAWLADPGHRAYRPPGSGAQIDLICYEPYDGERVWGLTARLVARFLACVGSVRWSR